ncbi:hypothetical protein D5086_001304 [Populus alba]|uniref:Uncharacterized protein n=1 Tax=Populus alba TaxID=43335 RepID=A0ACC4CZP5_POPAL
MPALAIIPQIRTPITIKPKIKHKQKQKPKSFSLSTTPITQASFSDPFVLQLAETLEDSLSPSVSLQRLRDSSSESLLSTSWPSRKDEPFRFTDTSFIRLSQIIPITKPPQFDYLPSINGDTLLPNIVIADGFVLNSMSRLSTLPDGVYVGAHDMTVVYVPAGVKVENPIHFKYVSVEGGEKGSKKLPVSNPRVFVVVEEGGEVGIIEEFVSKEGNDDRYYWANPVLEVVIGKGAKVRHSYVQSQSLNSAHIKWTAVRQEAASTYELVEVSTGGKLSRHNLHVQQLGPDTATELSTFHLSVGDQTQDLHSRLILDHPRGRSQQLHKCIVAHSQGQAVFDGNVKVNSFGYPELVLICIVDDVKCSHGAAISDLEETQLFYFQARGIDLETARKALVFSFGAESFHSSRCPFYKTTIRYKETHFLLISCNSSTSKTSSSTKPSQNLSESPNPKNPSSSDHLKPLSATTLTTKDHQAQLLSKPKSTRVNPTRPKRSVLSLQRLKRSLYPYNPQIKELKLFAKKLNDCGSGENDAQQRLEESMTWFKVFNVAIDGGVKLDDRFCGCLLSVASLSDESEDVAQVLACLQQANPKLVALVKLFEDEETSI